MGSADAPPPPPPPLPLLLPLLLLALGISSLVGTGHALPQGTSSAETPVLGTACSGADDCATIPQAECRNGTCQCRGSHPIANGRECLTVSWVNGDCMVSAQCLPSQNKAVCSSDKKCVCIPEHKPHEFSDGSRHCVPKKGHVKKTPVDPVMIGILVSLVLMFLIICIVLQLFSKARFRQNRTILNSANPRLMNTSFLKGTSGKLGSAGGGRGHRGSRASDSESSHDKADGGANQLTERPVGAGSDPSSDKSG